MVRAGLLCDEHLAHRGTSGIHAETPAERQHYADRFELLYKDTERVLAFERATQAAWRRLGKPMFEAARLPGASAPLSSNRDQLWGKRLALFVATQDCPRCAKSARNSSTSSPMAVRSAV